MEEASRVRFYLEVEGRAPLGVRWRIILTLKSLTNDRKFICRDLYWVRGGRLFLSANHISLAFD